MGDLVISAQGRSVVIPYEIISYLDRGSYDPFDNIKSYRSFLEVSTLDKKPSFHEFLLYLNLANLQKIADAQLRAIALAKTKLSSCVDDERYKLEKDIKSFEAKHQEVASLILKYVNAGVDRETPKQQNITVQTLDLNSIHQQIRVVDVDSEEE